MLLDREQSLLLIIDIQQKLIPHISNHQQVIDNTRWLMGLVKELKVPTMISEQYPKGLGSTVDDLVAVSDSKNRIPTYSKVHFSCVADDKCFSAIEGQGKEQVVIAGIESHVCVLQTAIELAAEEKHVFVVTDAIGARNKADHEAALDRMAGFGVELVTKEMVFFEWLRRAGTDQFKALSKRFMRGD